MRSEILALGFVSFALGNENASELKNDVKFYLWTRRNTEVYQTFLSNDSSDGFTQPRESNFDSTKETRIFIHGFVNWGLKRYILEMKDAFLQSGS